MSNHFIRFIAFSLCMTCALNTNALERVTIAYGDYKPYFAHLLPNHGVLNIIVKEALLLEDIECEFVYSSGVKVRQKIQKGQADASVAWTPTEPRKEFAIFSDVIINADVVFFHLKHSEFEWQTITDLNKFKIGTTVAYFYGDNFEQNRSNLNEQVAPSDKANFNKLLGKRIDAFPLNLDVGLDMLKRTFTSKQRDKVTYHSTMMYSEPLALMISKKSPHANILRERFNSGLKKLKKRGRYGYLVDQLRNGHKMLDKAVSR